MTEPTPQDRPRGEVVTSTPSSTVRIRDFFGVLFEHAHGLIELRALPSKHTVFCARDDAQAVEAFAKAHSRESVYFGVATRRDDSGGALSNCVDLPALFVDLDFKDNDEPTTRQRLANSPLRPTLVVESGGGLHAYWKLGQAMPAADAKPILRRLATHFGADMASAESARVLRLPHTRNYKYDPPRPVSVGLFEPESTFDVSNFDEWLPAETTPTGSAPFTVPGSFVSGTRNATLYRLCRSLVAKGLTPAAVLAAAREENAQRSTPPLDDRELQQIVAHAVEQPDQPGFERHPIAPAGDPPSLSTWRLLDDVELLDLPDPQWLIEGVFQDRGIIVVYAPPGAGKTTIMASAMVALATGTTWFGHQVIQRTRSVYVGAEDPSGFKIRLAAAKRASRLPLDQPIGVFTFPEAIDLRDPVSVTAFVRFMEAHFPEGNQRPRLTVIDTYAASTPGAAENSSEDTGTAIKHAQYIRDTFGCAVCLVHHTNASGTRERGHSSLRGSADTMIEVQPVDDVLHVFADKQRNGVSGQHLCTLTLVPEPGGGCVPRLASDVLPSEQLSAAQRKAYDVLRESFGFKGATKSEWIKSTTGVAERTFHRAAKVLQERGFVATIGSRFRVTTTVPP